MNERFVGFNVLKQSVSMMQVLDRYGLTQMLRHAGDSLSGACPLHQGHNPTQFRVSLSKNCWMCFGDCHTGGSIVDFVSRMEGVGIREAGLLLQDWFNLKPDRASEVITASLPALPARDPDGSAARNPANPPLRFSLGGLDGSHPYLQERGLTLDTVGTFGVGCCAQGWFRGWIAIPIHDLAGRIVAYAGRWPGIPPEGIAKYRLPRGFRKSFELFNQHRAASQNHDQPLVVVEGFFGCMWVWQAGHHRVVALMGSLLSKAQLERILALTGDAGRVLLFFDGDAAGRDGCADALKRLSPYVPVTTASLQDGQQPDSLSPEELRWIIGQQSEKEAA